MKLGLAGTNDGPLLDARFANPTALAIDSIHKILYVGEKYDIRMISIASATVVTLAGSGFISLKVFRKIECVFYGLRVHCYLLCVQIVPHINHVSKMAPGLFLS